jgi:diketogulonate reductase-like aldo/keto reductase
MTTADCKSIWDRRRSRREVLLGGAAAAAALALPRPGTAGAGEGLRQIPSDGRWLPAIGMGTWITFNVGRDKELREARSDVLAAFFQAGGRVIDSSPMYGSSQEVIGFGLERTDRPPDLFAADKIWTGEASEGAAQAESSRRHWGVPRFQLLQVHNLLAWQAHLKTLRAMRESGLLDYIGVTTSHGRRHDDLLGVMRREPLDFIQVTYNPVDREVEEHILPLAQERGIGVIVNRPFRRGALTSKLEGKPLPGYFAELGAATWAQAILKFIVSHPAVTVAIPATTQPAHARENVEAAATPLPDAGLRARIAADIAAA